MVTYNICISEQQREILQRAVTALVANRAPGEPVKLDEYGEDAEATLGALLDMDLEPHPAVNGFTL